MTDTDTMHDHFTVISRVGGIRTSRVVIAGDYNDAARTHREHYGGDIIRIIDNWSADPYAS
jgi:hypothetical protein